MLDDERVLEIAQYELTQTYGGNLTQGNIPNLETSLDYYLGNPNGREVEGRSQVTSTDVADAIEWIMPQIMESFTSNNQIVCFDAIHEGDELQAELESEYVYEVLMKQNDGFVLIHQFVKDALMQRNGILKVYYEDDTKEWVSSYTGITEQELNVLGSSDDAEIVDISAIEDEASQQMLYDVSVRFTSNKGRIVIDAIAPEEFRVNSDHNSINLDSARFTAHVTETTISELVSEGYDLDMLKELPTSSHYDPSDYRFTAQGEEIENSNFQSGDTSQQTLDIAECYLLMDYNEDGISELCKVTLAGGESPTHVLSVEELEMSPWVSTTAIIMSHKWQGLSIFDRLREIQDQKTALWRSMFDNVYYQNNQRLQVVEGQVNKDDLLVSRPNGIVRVKRLGAIEPIVTPQLSADSFNMMRHLDEVKAGRSGVSAEGGATPQNVGDRVGSQGVERMMNAKEALVGLIIRVIAETGIKPLCIKVRDLATRHNDAIVDFKFRGDWQKIQPSSWGDRTSTTVRVGTGTGNTTEKVNALTYILATQERLIAVPNQSIVDYKQAYDTMDEYCKSVGLVSASKYFIDPASKEGQQKKQQAEQSEAQEKEKNDKIQAIMAESQNNLAKAEIHKAQAQIANVQLKAEIDTTKNQLQLQKQTSDSQISALQQQLSEARLLTDSLEKSDDLQFKYDDMNARNAIEMARIEAEKNTEINNNVASNMETLNNGDQ